MNIKAVKQSLNMVDIMDLPKELKKLEKDERQGVQRLINSYLKKYNNYICEQARLEEINIYENEFYSAGFNYIAGMDEVGRGPLAGPVVACALILPKNCRIQGVNDSKQLSEKAREKLYGIIISEAISVGMGSVEAEQIDDIGIVRATHIAMQTALRDLNCPADCVLVDGYKVPGLGVEQKAIIRGDSKSISIAAASIIAKVARDRLMYNYHNMYPEYGFNSNKGYGSKKHIQAIWEIGLSPIHRRSFTKQFLNVY